MSGDETPYFGADETVSVRAVSPDAIGGIIDENETAGGAFISPEGLSRVDDGQRRHVDIPVLLVVTDRRILFVSAADGEPGEDAGDLPYRDILTVSVGAVTDRQLEIATTGGVNWQYRFPDGVDEAVDRIERHLTWVGDIREEVLRLRSDVELAAGEIRALADDREYGEAITTYERIRSLVDQLIQRVQLTEPIPDTVLAPELTDIERTLESAHASVFIKRARSRLELGDQLFGSDRYQQADNVLADAWADYEWARGISEAVRRADSFQFGRQRELNEELDRIRFNLEMVAAEPVRQAREAKLKAESEPDRTVAIEHWESAFQRYQYVHLIEWESVGKHLQTDQTARAEMEAAAQQAYWLRIELAGERWNTGISKWENGDPKAALTDCLDASEHLTQARQLAAEADVGDLDRLAADLERMEAVTAELRTADTESSDEQSAETDDSAEALSDEPAEDSATEPSDSFPSAESLRGLDTHHDILLQTDGDKWADAAGDGRTHEERSRGHPEYTENGSVGETGREEEDAERSPTDDPVNRIDAE